MTLKQIDIIAVAYEKFGQLKVFVQSWLNQTESNWKLTVIHDGHNLEFNSIMTDFQKQDPLRIHFWSTPHRYNDYGHSLREIGLQSAQDDYVMLTNADNYFVPKTIELINLGFEAIAPKDPDVIMFNMIHSHMFPGDRKLPPYSFFDVKFERFSIDVSSAIVKTHLAKSAGFKDKSLTGDATYFEDIKKICRPKELNVVKLPMVLFVHN